MVWQIATKWGEIHHVGCDHEISRGTILLRRFVNLSCRIINQHHVSTNSLPASQLARELISDRDTVPFDHGRACVPLVLWHRSISDSSFLRDARCLRILCHPRVPSAVFSFYVSGSLDCAVLYGHLRRWRI